MHSVGRVCNFKYSNWRRSGDIQASKSLKEVREQATRLSRGRILQAERAVRAVSAKALR